MCGRAVWPPGPLTRISTTSAAAVSGPERTPTRPVGSCGAQRHDPVTLADVADDPVAFGQEPGGQPGHRELAGHQRRGLELLAGQLRVGVDVATYRDQFRTPGSEPAVELAG